MVGRLDDRLRVLVERDDDAVDPAAPYRHRLGRTELVGGDVIVTLARQWQARCNAGGVEACPRIGPHGWRGACTLNNLAHTVEGGRGIQQLPGTDPLGGHMLIPRKYLPAGIFAELRLSTKGIVIAT